MPGLSSSVTLTVVSGELAPPALTVAKQTTCVLGRADDCDLRVPNDAAHQRVSRHHCLLDIDPPEIFLRDLGSRNGTYVNGQKISQSEAGQEAEETRTRRYPGQDLSDGDEIRLGPVTIRISVRQAQDPGHQQQTRTCACCGRGDGYFLDLPDTGDQHRICVSCMEDPEAVAGCLIKLARAGEPQLGMLSRYDLASELGRGGMGAVYLARHSSTGEQIALKLMLPKAAGTPRGRARFLREATLASSLHHQNIAESYGALTAAGTYCFTSRYYSGGSLAQLLRGSGGRLPVDEAIPLIIQVLDGLDHAHRSGVVHRDLSMGNILLDKTGAGALIPKISDFGLGKLFSLAGLSGLTQTSDHPAGKPAYMARQQVINFRYAKPAVDVWAAAACLYRMLTGSPPRDFPACQSKWVVVRRDPAVPIRHRDPSIPADLADIIDRALRDTPEIGCQNALELRDPLQAFSGTRLNPISPYQDKLEVVTE